jgi:predicted enzyme related to lactoylglutathione lyase
LQKERPWHIRIVWVDIPVVDLDRAILGGEVTRQEFQGLSIAILPHQDGEMGGCLFKQDGERPSDHGPLLYLNADGRIDQAIAAVEPNGGKIIQPRHPIGPYGFRAVVLDSEGNRTGRHSR